MGTPSAKFFHMCMECWCHIWGLHQPSSSTCVWSVGVIYGDSISQVLPHVYGVLVSCMGTPSAKFFHMCMGCWCHVWGLHQPSSSTCVWGVGVMYGDSISQVLPHVYGVLVSCMGTPSAKFFHMCMGCWCHIWGLHQPSSSTCVSVLVSYMGTPSAKFFHMCMECWCHIWGLHQPSSSTCVWGVGVMYGDSISQVLPHVYGVLVSCMGTPSAKFFHMCMGCWCHVWGLHQPSSSTCVWGVGVMYGDSISQVLPHVYGVLVSCMGTPSAKFFHMCMGCWCHVWGLHQPSSSTCVWGVGVIYGDSISQVLPHVYGVLVSCMGTPSAKFFHMCMGCWCHVWGLHQPSSSTCVWGVGVMYGDSISQVLPHVYGVLVSYMGTPSAKFFHMCISVGVIYGDSISQVLPHVYGVLVSYMGTPSAKFFHMCMGCWCHVWGLHQPSSSTCVWGVGVMYGDSISQVLPHVYGVLVSCMGTPSAKFFHMCMGCWCHVWGLHQPSSSTCVWGVGVIYGDSISQVLPHVYGVLVSCMGTPSAKFFHMCMGCWCHVWGLHQPSSSTCVWGVGVIYGDSISQVLPHVYGVLVSYMGTPSAKFFTLHDSIMSQPMLVIPCNSVLIKYK